MLTYADGSGARSLLREPGGRGKLRRPRAAPALHPPLHPAGMRPYCLKLLELLLYEALSSSTSSDAEEDEELERKASYTSGA